MLFPLALRLRRLGEPGPQGLLRGRQGQHDEGRHVLPQGGHQLLEPRGEDQGHGQGRHRRAGALHRARHVQLLGEKRI